MLWGGILPFLPLHSSFKSMDIDGVLKDFRKLHQKQVEGVDSAPLLSDLLN